ncbi:MAG: aminotransferase class I/II-fold pyridoxal phosphate-dependent enzyme [Patescibacteria group bacterium]
MDPAQLIALTKQISKYEKITLIFDNVYVSLLETHISKSIFKEIFEDENIKNKIIVCESMSKTFGTTGIRIAWTRGFNKDLMLEIRKINSLHKAGFSKLLVEFLRNIL